MNIGTPTIFGEQNEKRMCDYHDPILNEFFYKIEEFIEQKEEIIIRLKNTQQDLSILHQEINLYYQNILMSLNSIIFKVQSYYKRKSFYIFSEKKQKELQEMEFSLLETLEKIKIIFLSDFSNKEKEILDVEFQNKLANSFSYKMPVSLSPLFDAIELFRFNYVHLEEMIDSTHKKQENYEKQIEAIEKKIQDLQTEFYA